MAKRPVTGKQGQETGGQVRCFKFKIPRISSQHERTFGL